MSRIQSLSLRQLRELKQSLREALHPCTSFEVAAQEAMNILYHEFADSVKLARLYATTVANKLPAQLKLVASQFGEVQINDSMLVLFGTRGVLPDWNLRQNSKGHAVLPLLSSSFIQSLPMLAGLFSSLGVNLGQFDKKAASQGESLWGGLASIFYVKDAATERDASGRFLIPAQDFVAAHQIKTVFGVGSGYISGQLMTILFFCNETVSREQIEQFVDLVSVIKLSTISLISEKLFLPPDSL
jgi:hypothetical protein